MKIFVASILALFIMQANAQNAVERIEADTARSVFIVCDTAIRGLLFRIEIIKGFAVTEYKYFQWGYDKNKYYLDEQRKRIKSNLVVFESAN